MLELRDYQEAAITSIFSELEEHQRTLVVAPTGCGKTVIFCHLLDQYCLGNDRCLIVAHTDELIRQAYDKVTSITNEAPGIEKASDWVQEQTSFAHQRQRVVVTSIQTQNSKMGERKRMERFKPGEFRLLIIDEAHHAVAETYQRLIDYHCQDQKTKTVGFTATPDRADERALGQVFQSVAFDYELQLAIQDGWLVPIRQQFIEVDQLDISQVKTVAGDLHQGQLARVLEDEKLLHQMVSPTLDIAGDRQVIFYTHTVAQAEAVCEIFERHKTGAPFIIHGKTPEEERRQLNREFLNGDRQFFVNCQVAIEGYDCSAPIIAIGKPTKSRSRYAQMVGRGTRPDPSVVEGLNEAHQDAEMTGAETLRREIIFQSCKPNMLVLDFVGNSGRHKLVHVGDLLGGKYDDDVQAQAAKEALEEGGEVDMEKLLVKVGREMGELGRQLRRMAKIKASWRAHDVDPFDVFDLRPDQVKGWFKGRAATPKQQQALLKFGVDEKRVAMMDFTCASQLMDTLIKRIHFNLCSYKQAKLLAKFGESADIGFKDASAKINEIAANNWRPLAGAVQ